MTLTTPETMLFTLLRAALWQQPVPTAPFAAATDNDWTACIRLAASQGVQAIAFDGAVTLPTALQPPRPLKLTWAAGAVAIRQRHDCYLNTLTHLVQFFATHGISVMLLKGLGLATDYPIPAHRESGDLDIWLFGKYTEGNHLIAAQGIPVDLHGPKHSCFRFEGIPVENHRTFLNVTLFRIDRQLEPVLMQAIAAGGSSCLPLPDNTLLPLPPATFNALFLARHMCTHFANNIVVRHLCDWACFLRAHHGQYDPAAFRVILSKTRLSTPVEAFTALAVEYLGLPPEYSPFPETSGQVHTSAGTTAQQDSPVASPEHTPGMDPAALQERILTDILRPEADPLPEGGSAFSIITFKWHRFTRNRWKYQLVHRQTFARRLWTSVVSHMLNPSSILRLK